MRIQTLTLVRHDADCDVLGRRDSSTAASAVAECPLKGLRAPEMAAGQALNVQLSVMQGHLL